MTSDTSRSSVKRCPPAVRVVTRWARPTRFPSRRTPNHSSRSATAPAGSGPSGARGGEACRRTSRPTMSSQERTVARVTTRRMGVADYVIDRMRRFHERRDSARSPRTRPTRRTLALGPSPEGAGVVDRLAAEHGAQHLRAGELVEAAARRVAIDDDQIGVAPRPERPDAFPAEHPRRVARPHEERLVAAHRLRRPEVSMPAHVEAMRLGQLEVLEDVLRPPVAPARHPQPGREHAAERDQIRPDVASDALGEQVALAPAERHAGGDVEAEARVAARRLLGEEEDVLEDPVAATHSMASRHRLGAVEEFVVIAIPGADEVQAQPAGGAELERDHLLLAGDEGVAARRFAVWPPVGLVHAKEARPARTAARERDP